MKKIVVLFLISLSAAVNAQLYTSPLAGRSVISECDYCQCSQGISPFETGASGIRLEWRSLYRGAPYNGSKKQPNPNNQYESYLTSQLIANYRASESPFTFSALIPYVLRQAHDPMATPVNVKGEGIGDITAIVRFNHKDYINEAMIGYSFSAGVKFPTGSTNITNSIGVTLDPHIRPGTGTTDFIIGGSGIWALDRTGISASAASGFITGRGAPLAYGGGYHKFGNYLMGEITARYRIIPADVSESNLSITCGLGAEIHGKETEGGQEKIASGESLIFVTPGLKFIISMNLSLDASVEIPIYQYEGWDPVTGDNQLGQAYRIVAGIQYLL